jgi:biopolymer transport protein ExbD
MRFHDSARRGRLAINLTSLIDVLFLLLIFVLVSARFEEVGGVAVELPQGRSKELPKRQTLILTLTAEGDLYLDEEPLSLAALGPALRAAAARARETTLVVRADQAVRSGRLLQAMDVAKQQGLERVAFQMRE